MSTPGKRPREDLQYEEAVAILRKVYGLPPIPKPPTVPRLSYDRALKILRKFTDGGRLGRGQDIHNFGGFRRCAVGTDYITARVPGMHKPYYTVRIKFRGDPYSFLCSCPDGGACKHCSALLCFALTLGNLPQSLPKRGATRRFSENQIKERVDSHDCAACRLVISGD